MFTPATLVVLGLVLGCGAAPQGVHFVGVGYNLLKGNPDGGMATRGGVDPGLLFTRRIFAMSPGDVPPEVVYEPRHSCAKEETLSVFYGTKSYQDKLNVDVSSSGKYAHCVQTTN
jgi:hypothetical protein